MKKIIIPFILMITFCSLAGYAQQKPSQRSLASEMNKVKEKQLLRNKMSHQNKQQITETNDKMLEPAVQQSSQKNDQHQQNQKPVRKSSAQPIKIPDRSRKQG